MGTYITGYQGEFNPSRRARIPSGEEETETIPCGGMVLTGISIPTIFTGDSLTFLVADNEDGFQSQGLIDFTDTPAPAEGVSINGAGITFVVSSPVGNEVVIGGTPALTAANLLAFLESTTDERFAVCTYERDDTTIILTAVDRGVSGNNIALATTSSSIDLTGMDGGGFRYLYDDTNTIVSLSISPNRFYSVDSSLFQGVAFLQLVSNNTEGATRDIFCSLKGF